MNPGKQSTLFQSWGKKERPSGTAATRSAPFRPPINGQHAPAEIVDLCDADEDEDALLAQALEESLLSAAAQGTEKGTGGDANDPTTSAFTHPGAEPPPFESNQLDDLDLDNCANIRLSQIEDLPGFDKVAGQLWIYPTNYPVREYQYNIVSKALFKNTLVTLPTGLGKTFIAAVLMYNFYRWYPQGKVVFMAPTKPLVAQQIEACYNIMGIPQGDTAEMTGTMAPAERLKAWNYKRVFFLTPQVLTNDLSRGACPSVDMRCLVIDEAHKALGNHAYCQVVRELVKYTRDFRILALSATPGSDIKAVQQVVANLLVSHIELRTEESIDIQPYVHERKVSKIVVPLGRELTAIKEKYIKVMDVIVGRLTRQKVLYNRQTTSLSKFMILKAREAFRQNPPQQLQRTQYGAIEGDFAIAMSLYHGYELLQLHGLKSLYSYLDSLVSGDKGYGRTRTELTRNGDFRNLMEELHTKFGQSASAGNQINPFGLSQRQTPNMPFVSGHPKMEKLKEVVLQHFNKYSADGLSTRIMIFSQYRDSVTEITDMLCRHRPLVKVMSFIGQSSAGKATKGFTQKEQLKVMKKFREGGYNTLVSTCVGEEGLDIGDVDLIVCFDASKSPIRLVQRMGRTGRKRQGSIVMLMTEGKEEQVYNQSQYSKKSIHKAILNGARSLQFYPNSPRMVPDGLEPRCHKMHITVQTAFVSTAKGRAPKTTAKEKAQKITGMLEQKGKKALKGDGLLTESELSYWTEHFKMPSSEVPKLPNSDFTCFKKKNQPQVLTTVESTGPLLRMSEWMPWQNRKHATQMLGHSMKTEHLVEMMEFIELQQMLGEDDDSYSTEMASYMNYDLVIQDTVEKGGIKKFCLELDTDDADSFANQKANKPGKMVKRSEGLPTFDSDGHESNSDEDLPPFLLRSSVMEEKGNCEVSSNNEDLRNKIPESENPQAEKMEKKNAVNLTTKSSKTGGKKGSCSKLKSSKPKSVSQGKGHDELFKPRKKKKRFSSGSVSVVEVILDADDCDFDVPPAIGEEPVPMETESGTEVFEVQPEKKSAVKDISVIRQEMEAKIQFDLESARLSQLLPDFSSVGKGFISPSFLQGSCERSDKHIDTPDRSTLCEPVYNVPSPPAMEDMEAALANIDSPSKLQSVDFLQLVDEWEQEKRTKRKTVYPLRGIENEFTPSKSSANMDILSVTSPTIDLCPPRKQKVSVAVHHVRLSSDSRGQHHSFEGATKAQPEDFPESEEFDYIVNSQALESNKEDMESKIHNAENMFSEKCPVLSQKDKPLESNDEFQSDELKKMKETFSSLNGESTKEKVDVDIEMNECDILDYFDRCDENITTENCEAVPLEKPVCVDIHKNPKSKNIVCENKNIGFEGTDDHGADSSPKSSGHCVSPEHSSDGENKNKPQKSVVFVSQGFTSNRDFSSSNKNSQLTVDSLADVSLEIFDDLETGDDYGAWDLEISDAENEQNEKTGENKLSDFECALNEDRVDMEEVPGSPVFNPCPLPFKRYSDPGVKSSLPVARVVPLSQTKTPLSPEPANKNSVFDEDDDIFLADVNTPQSVKKHQVDGLSCVKSARKLTPGRTLDESQVTFTQALYCLHDSPAPTQGAGYSSNSARKIGHTRNAEIQPLAQSSTSTSKTNSAVNLGQSADTDRTVMKCNREIRFVKNVEDARDQFEAEKTSNVPSNLSNIDNSIALFQDSDSDSNDRPQFDLGFNWNDDIIPPSPVALHEQSVSQRNKCSQSMVFGKKRLTSLFEQTETSAAMYEHTETSNVFEIPFEDSVIFAGPNISQKQQFRKITSPLDEQEPSANSPTFSAQRQELPKSPVFTPVVLSAQATGVNSAESNVHSSDSEESFCVHKKRGGKTAIIDSPAQSSANKIDPFEFKTPSRPKPGHKKSPSAKNLKFSSEDSEDSPVNRHRNPHTRWQRTRSTALPREGSEDDDDFADTSHKFTNTVWRSRNRNSVVERNKAGRKKKKRSAGACQFIEHEAELSSEGASEVSDDEVDNTQMDSMLDGFINDCSQMTQVPGQDDQLMYLRSVRSPLVTDRDGVYRRDRPTALEVCSQPPPLEDSEYMEDSFCVLGEEEEEDGTDESHLGEITCFYPTKKKAKPSKRKRGQEKRPRGKDGNRRRVVCLQDSSSEDEHHVSLISPDKPLVNKPAKRPRILSSSDEEMACVRKKFDQKSSGQSMTGCVAENDASPPLLSLRSRLQVNRTNADTTGFLIRSNLSQTDAKTNLSDHGSSEKFASKNTLRTQNTSVSLSKSAVSPDLGCKVSKPEQNSALNSSHPPRLKTAEELRDERLRRQREKQEEYRRKMLKDKQPMESKEIADCNKASRRDSMMIDVQDSPASNPNNFTKLLTPGRRSVSLGESCLPSDSCLITSPRLNLDEKKMTIFVDSREITGGQEVVSHLRQCKDIHVSVRQLAGCDYILSNRMAVERKNWSDFANGSNRSKLQERIQQMCSLFDRQCLIVERDRVKPGEEKSARPQVRTKYVDQMLAWMTMSTVRLLFTDSQEETAALLSELCRSEERKGMAVCYPTRDLTTFQEQMLKFYTCIPRISFVTAFNLCHNFKNLKELSSSSVKTIQVRGHISESQASDLKQFIQHQFCLSLVPASYQ